MSVLCIIPSGYTICYPLAAEKMPFPRICSSTFRSRSFWGFMGLLECLLFVFPADFCPDLLALLNFKIVNLVEKGEVSCIFVVSLKRTLSGGEA